MLNNEHKAGINKNEIDLCLFSVIKAGKEILKIYNNDITVEYKSDLSPITAADKSAHDVIVEHLSQTPYPILSEEGMDINFHERLCWECYWLIDPLDGTKEFINRNGEFTVNIALINNGVPVFGIVYAPVLKILYIGIAEEGAWKVELENDKFPDKWKIKKNQFPIKQPSNKCFTVVASRSHTTIETNNFIAELEKIHGQLEFISMGSSLKLCLVAEGKADIYPRLAPTMEWDTAAGDAITRSAGCKVVQFDNGEPLRYNKENLLNPWFIVKR